MGYSTGSGVAPMIAFMSSTLFSDGGTAIRPVALIHGGLLDIYDSLLFAAPALLALRALL